MKNYLKALREYLVKNKKTEIPNNKHQENNTTNLNDIAQVIGLDFVLHDMRKLHSESGWGGANKFAMDKSNIIYFYPPNDGMPTCPFEFYKGKNLIIDNQNAYSEITNLDELVLQLLRIFTKALDDKVVLDPYYFMLQLEDEIKTNYNGKARMLVTEKAIRNQKLNTNNFDEATQYYINHFLDHFIAWNFGLSAERNEQVKTELDALNKKVIDMGIREYAGTGFEVWCSDNVKHYDFPEINELRKDWSKKKRLSSKN